MALPTPPLWPGRDGAPIACREKLTTLAENHAELTAIMRDAYEDAVLMGVADGFFRTLLHAMVDSLESPRRDAP